MRDGDVVIAGERVRRYEEQSHHEQIDERGSGQVSEGQGSCVRGVVIQEEMRKRQDLTLGWVTTREGIRQSRKVQVERLRCPRRQSARSPPRLVVAAETSMMPLPSVRSPLLPFFDRQSRRSRGR